MLFANPTDFAENSLPLLRDTQTLNNSVKEIMLRDRARCFENAREMLLPGQIEALHFLASRPSEQPRDELLSSMVSLGLEPAAQRNWSRDAFEDFVLSLWGPWDTECFGPYEFMRRRNLAQPGESLEFWTAVHTSFMCLLMTPDLVAACLRPLVIRRDERGRPHAADGPALEFLDGTFGYRWHGLPMPPEFFVNPITTQLILSESNIEVRRALVEMYGFEAFVRDVGCKKIDNSEFGTLYRYDFERDEALCLVSVKNSTPEPDGSYREYFLRVPPNMVTARQAVAWTFGMTATEYNPTRET
jgi:hypothetical protein